MFLITFAIMHILENILVRSRIFILVSAFILKLHSFRDKIFQKNFSQKIAIELLLARNDEAPTQVVTFR